jgi:hypothetical protein
MSSREQTLKSSVFSLRKPLIKTALVTRVEGSTNVKQIAIIDDDKEIWHIYNLILEELTTSVCLIS